MRNPSQAIMSALSRDSGGIAIIWSPEDLGVRDWLASEVESLAPPATSTRRCTSVEEVIAHPDELMLLLPKIGTEADVVLDLNGSRDRVINGEPQRTQPVVLFLFRDGNGQRALSVDAPSLRSITIGSDPDPEELAEIDVPAERKALERETGESPASWLKAWNSGQKAHTGANYTLAYRAMLLES